MKPVGRTKTNGMPVARMAASPRACHAPVPTCCAASAEESLTRRRTPEALATFAIEASCCSRSGPEVMLLCYALEKRSTWFVLGFAVACALGSTYGFLQGAWPFGIVEAIWSLVAVRRWWAARRAEAG